MTKLLVASSNPGKLRDFAVAARDLNVSIEPLPGLKNIPAPPEEEPTFAANARAKAIYYSRFAAGNLVLADDSGLEVDALGGAPGVRSARYAEDAGAAPDNAASADERNNLHLLSQLEAVPAGQRRARYRCSLAAALDGVCLYTGEGAVEGEILAKLRGEGGFGYDPLFHLPSLGRTMAEIDLGTKQEISHRGKAFRALLQSTATDAILDARRQRNQ